ncbi:hypothetical protein LCGC14_0776440 [marine sediment metagenome]|uniref:Peptidase C39-like domain-containing protein n=1 Tax=marine sediment metagenome TaxID=412755 RepID=A0A0F9SGR1_9ZZZZ
MHPKERKWLVACGAFLAIAVILILMIVLASPASGAESNVAVDLPEEQRVRFRNMDGSCVQCSIGMLGVHMNQLAAELLLWSSPYGPAVRHGSGPSRVREYCNARGIPAFNVTGDTLPWVEWALLTGRGAAITWGRGHMVTAVGISPNRQLFAICDNNSPYRIQWVDRNTFVTKHGNRWAVIVRGPRPPGVPAVYPWWNLSIGATR